MPTLPELLREYEPVTANTGAMPQSDDAEAMPLSRLLRDYEPEQEQQPATQP